MNIPETNNQFLGTRCDDINTESSVLLTSNGLIILKKILKQETREIETLSEVSCVRTPDGLIRRGYLRR